ncbi:MAG: hypothetical protein K8T20_12290 [Planctomycetes bacterium]|nr:hypothetical protein [Planctomycetota bacterium]
MKTAAMIAALALFSLPATADDAMDRVKKAIDALAQRDGYVHDADWSLVIDKVAKPVKGHVESLVNQKNDFLRLNANFDETPVTVYQKGTIIAAQDPETKNWGPASDDPKAKFVLKMFNLKVFLAEAAGMATNARLSKSDLEGCLRVEFDADQEKLKKLLGDAEAGKALTNGTLENATMRVSLEVERASGELRLLTVDIEGDSKSTTARKPVGDGKEEGWDEWDPDSKGEKKKKPEPAPADPKPADPKPEEPAAPVVEHIKVHIGTTSLSYNARLEVPVPDAARKVLGM